MHTLGSPWIKSDITMVRGRRYDLTLVDGVGILVKASL